MTTATTETQTILHHLAALAKIATPSIPAPTTLSGAVCLLIKSGVLTLDGASALVHESEDVEERGENFLVVAPNVYNCADSYGGAMTIDADDAESAAKGFFDGGEWGEESAEISVRTWRDGIDKNGDTVQVDVEDHEFSVSPPEPECADGADEHEWESPVEIVGGCKENPGVFSSGHGSIKCESVCMDCGCRRVIDYGATNPENGTQMEKITYEEGYYADKITA